MRKKYSNPAGHRRVALQGVVPTQRTDGNWASIGPSVERELKRAIDEETAAGEARRGRPTPTLRQEAELIGEDAIRLEMERRLARRLQR